MGAYRDPPALPQVALEGTRAETLPECLYAKGPGGRARPNGRTRRLLRPPPPPARPRDRAAHREHRPLLRGGGAPLPPRRRDGPQKEKGRFRNQRQPPLLQ